MKIYYYMYIDGLGEIKPTKLLLVGNFFETMPMGITTQLSPKYDEQ